MAALPRPTDAELEILRVLWAHGPSTVRQVNERVSTGRDVGYTTTLKLMQIMAEKGLVSRDESDRTHIYFARATQGQTQRQRLNLMDRAFGGSAAALVLQALNAQPASQAELEEIGRLIRDYQTDQTPADRKRGGKSAKQAGEHHE